MNGTRARSSLGGDERPIEHDDPARRQQLWALAVPAVGLLFETVALALSTAPAPEVSDTFEVAVWLWMATPFALTGVLVGIAAGRTRLGWWLTVGLGVAITLAGVAGYVLYRTSKSSTAALIFLFGPPWQLGAVVVVGIVVLALRAWAERSPRR